MAAPHFALFPLMAQGHLVPMVDIARILAQRGATVTIITTPLAANRFRPIITRAIEAKLKIQLLELELQLAQVGLPEGCETLDKLSSSEHVAKFYSAMDLLEQPAENILRELCPSPDCIISDFFFSWTTNVARRFNIPRIVFHGPGCFWLMCMHVAVTSNLLQTIESDSERFVLPGLPDRVEVTKLQLTGPTTSHQSRFIVRAMQAEKAVYGVVVHTFNELEPDVES